MASDHPAIENKWGHQRIVWSISWVAVLSRGTQVALGGAGAGGGRPGSENVWGPAVSPTFKETNQRENTHTHTTQDMDKESTQFTRTGGAQQPEGESVSSSAVSYQLKQEKSYFQSGRKLTRLKPAWCHLRKLKYSVESKNSGKNKAHKFIGTHTHTNKHIHTIVQGTTK